jgi:hypothetical protein
MKSSLNVYLGTHAIRFWGERPFSFGVKELALSWPSSLHQTDSLILYPERGKINCAFKRTLLTEFKPQQAPQRTARPQPLDAGAFRLGGSFEGPPSSGRVEPLPASVASVERTRQIQDDLRKDGAQRVADGPQEDERLRGGKIIAILICGGARDSN